MNDWSFAFLQQSKSDFAAANILAGYEEHRSQSTMLLQMAWEKLAKAALATSGSWIPEKDQPTHAVAAKFVSTLRRSRSAQSILWSGTPRQFNARMSSLKRELLALERLGPTPSQGGMNAEYPWRSRNTSGSDTVCWPARDITRRFSSPVGAPGIRSFFTLIVANFEDLFK